MAHVAIGYTRPGRLLLLALLVVAAVPAAASARSFVPDPQAGISATGCDWPGNDLGRVRTYSCALVCKFVIGCTHWTWNGDRGSTCYLKSGRRELSIKATGNVACGYMTRKDK